MAFWNKRKPVEPIIPAVHVDWEAKFKLAATDLARTVEEREDWKRMANDFGDKLHAAEIKRNKAIAWAKEQHGLADKYAEEITSLRPDALLWRAARDKRSRDRKAAKAGVAS